MPGARVGEPTRDTEADAADPARHEVRRVAADRDPLGEHTARRHDARHERATAAQRELIVIAAGEQRVDDRGRVGRH